MRHKQPKRARAHKRWYLGAVESNNVRSALLRHGTRKQSLARAWWPDQKEPDGRSHAALAEEKWCAERKLDDFAHCRQLHIKHT